MKEIKSILDFPSPKTAWDELSMPEKAEMIRVAVGHDIYSLKDIRERYNKFAEGGSTDADVVDWLLQEEGFNKKPEDIGDGKMTLGSGLTAKKWHDLYRKRGNKWSAADNRMAVTEEVANRRKWAEQNIPNWSKLPDSSQKALLSYKYNYDFNRSNSPKLFAALEKGDLQEAARQMDATSKDSKFRKGLLGRRQREQQWFLSDVPTTQTASVPTLFEQPVSTAVFNPYIQQVENTGIAPVIVPDDDSYVTAHRLTESEERKKKLQERMESIRNFNRLLELTSLDNTAVPAFMPTTGNTFLDSMMKLTKAEGGKIEKENTDIIPFTQKREVIITPDKQYNRYLNTLPDNQRFTSNDKYDSYQYWKLNGKPKNFTEAYNKGMFHYDHSDNGYHANSIAFDDNTGIGYFMKPKTHDTVGYELDWFNKGLVTEEGGWQRPETFLEWKESQPFRDSHILMEDPNRPNYYKYQPIERANGGGIHIKPSHRGRLTELKKRTGKTEAELYRTGSPATRKMITFARNARKWKHSWGGPLVENIFYPEGYIRDTNNHPVAFDEEGNLTDQVTGEKGTMMLPEVTVTGRDLAKPYYFTKDDAKPIRNFFSTIQEEEDTPIMVQQNPGTATGYSSFGQYMPKSQSTYGDQANLLLTELTAPTVLSDAKGIYQVLRHPAQTFKAVRSIFSEGTPAAEWAEVGNASEDITDNLLRFLGRPSSYKPDRTVKERLENLPSGYRKMASLLAEDGVDLSRIGVKDLQKAKKLRLNIIESTAPNRYALAVPTDKGYDLRDMIGSKDTGFDNVGLTELTLRPDHNTLMDMVQNLTRNPLTGEQTVHGVYKRGLNAAINTAQSEGGRGVVSGKLLISAPRQYPVIQQFKGRKVLGLDATHTNTNLVPNVYEAGASGVRDAESMLELRRAGKSTAKSLSNAPYWLLPNATEHIPTKSVLFSPTIIDKFGKMHIDWNDPNIFKGIAYPTIFSSTLYNLNNE